MRCVQSFIAIGNVVPEIWRGVGEVGVGKEVISSNDEKYSSDIENKNILQENSYVIPMKFCQLTREADVRFFTGLDGTKIFKVLFEHVQKKAP